MMSSNEALIQWQWRPLSRAYAYGALAFFTFMGLILWPMGMSPLSNVALFWVVGQVWSFGLSLAAFWSARRTAKARRPRRHVPNSPMSIGNQAWSWQSEGF
jgi:hypothetical protein